MADQKISELTALTGANVADDDAIAIVDTSATETKKIVFSELKNALDTATGFVRITGDTMTGDLALSGADVTFGDNDKAIFGAGSDLQIYHASSTNNSVIQETGSGNLLIYASNISMADAGGNEFILMTDTGTGGTVELKHNTSTKLATTSTGVDITGNVTMQADDALLFIKESDGTNIAAVGDLTGEGQGGAFYYDHGGTATIQLKSYEASTIENGLNVKGDISFYEDTGTTPKFFWDASAESLGIGTSSPSAPLNVSATYASDTTEQVRFQDNTGSKLDFFGNADGDKGIQAYADDGSTFYNLNLQPLGGNVGIGETSPDAKLHIRDSTDGGSSSTTSAIQFSRRNGGANDAAIKMQHDGSDGVSNLQFHFGTSEAMRIDSSGNLLVGKTASSFTTAGAEVQPSGRIELTRSGELINLNRLGSDGNLMTFYGSSALVGSIGALSDDLYINTGDTGLRFNDGNDQIWPVSSSGTSRDAAIDLGNSGVRFKNVFLSEGVYLGGTGSANKLDDYEEGTHTCTVTMGSGSCSLYSNYDKIRYTKIGNLVTIQGQIRVESVSSPSGVMSVSMPFSIDTTDDEGSNISGSLVRTYLGNAPTGGLFLHGTMVFNQSDKCNLQWSKSGSTTVDHVPTAGEYLIFNFSYNVA